MKRYIIELTYTELSDGIESTIDIKDEKSIVFLNQEDADKLWVKMYEPFCKECMKTDKNWPQVR